MSAKIIPASLVEAQPLSASDGINCKCRKSNWKNKPGKELAHGISIKKESLTLDLAPLLRKDAASGENPLTVFINCGSVPVEERRYWDVTVINSDRMRKGHQYKNIKIDDSIEDNTVQLQEGVFRVLTHPKHDITVPLPLLKDNAIADPSCTKHPVDNKKLTFRVLFHPQLPNLVYSKIFSLWIDNVPLKLKLRGYSLGPSICLSRSLINFGGVYVGYKGRRILELHNHSLAVARFQLQVDNTRSVFKFCPSNGIIQPSGTAKVEVTFLPHTPRSFYKRVYCIVHHQDPLVLDLLGISIPRPRFLQAPISFAVKLDEACCLPYSTDTFEDFIEGDQKWGVKFELERIDFGYRDPDLPYSDHDSEIVIKATSWLPYDTVLEWAPDSSRVFTVSPACGTLAANDSTVFNVNFKPTFPGAFYIATLECYVYPTGDTWDDLGPPWNFKFSTNENGKQLEVESKPFKRDTHAKSIAPVTRPSRFVIKATDPAVSAKSENVGSANENKRADETGNATVGIEAQPQVPNSTGVSGVQPPRQKSGDTVKLGAELMNASDNTNVEANVHTDDSHPPVGPPAELEHGYYLKVKMARLNEGPVTEFMVTPVTQQITFYDLPDAILSDEDISRIFRHGSESGAVGYECGYNPDNNQQVPKDSEHKYSNAVIVDDVASEHKRLGTNESIEIPSDPKNEDEDFIPSIHPSKIVVGSDEADPVVLNGIKKVALPMCITLTVTGHTFTPQRVPFIPNVKFPSKAVMNASTPGAPIGRTVLIKNLSDLPCFYDLERLDILDAFKVRPFVGLIHGNQHEIIVARMTPNQDLNAAYKTDVRITFNLQDNCLVGLHGWCEIPYLGIRVLYKSPYGEDEVVCPITIAGCVTYTYVELQNPTGFHYRFWLEPADVEEEEWMIITPQLSSGFIAPNETIPISWKFAPRIDGMYYLYWRFCFDVARTCSPTDRSVGYYEFIVPFSGVAKTSYLKAEPNHLDFDMIQIFDAKSRAITVRNDGECPVNAHFIVQHEQWLTNFPPEVVSVSPTRVSLKAQESVEVTVTVRPSRMNIQHFYVIYNLEFNDDDEFVQGAEMDVFEKHLVGITFMGDHTVFRFTDIIMDSLHSIWDAQQCWAMFSLSLLNQFLTPYHHSVPEGTVPQVSSVTFRFPPAPAHSPPCVFKLHLSNVSDLKGFWAVFTKPPKGWRKHLQQKICGTCGISEFKDGHFTDSPDLASQLWAKKFNYSTSSAYKIPHTCNNCKDLNLFEISPLNGSLKSKESQEITVKYSYSSLGSHEVSVLLRIFPSIYVWIDLTGRTLDLQQPYIQLMNKKSMNLHPVCLSDMDPPVQMFWVYNGGNIAATFSVDLEPFEKLKDENFGHSVIECLTPKGDIRPACWFPIKIRFSPLEYTHYVAPLVIYPTYDKTPIQALLLGSAAINPGISLRPQMTQETLRKFVLFAHGVPVTLSPAHITVSHLIPTGHSVTRIVFLTNLHSRNTMKYCWQNMPIEGGGMISFHPNCGRLAPKEEVSCKVTIKAGDTAAVLSTMISCTIEDETASVIYEFVLNQWQEYMKNKQLRDSEQSSNEVAHKPEKPETYNRLLAVSLYIGSVLGQYDNIHAKEKARMGFVAPLTNDRGINVSVDSLSLSPFTQTGSTLCQSVICNMIWDMVESPGFASFIRSATKRKAPLFEDYAATQEGNAMESKWNVSQNNVLASHTKSEILERSVFNIMHEMAERYAHTSTQQKWYEIPPVQPKALMDTQDHEHLLQFHE